MSKKAIILILISISIGILSLMVLLPSAEWMNYLMIVFIGILAYLFYLTHLRYFPKEDGQKALSSKEILIKIVFGIGLSVLSMGLIIIIISLMGGYSEGATYSSFEKYCELLAGNSSVNETSFLENMLLYASSALAEEVLFRSLCIGLVMIPISLLFLRLANRNKNQSAVNLNDSKIGIRVGIVLNLFFALLFGLVHKDSPGFGIIPWVNISISGFIYGYLFLIHKDIISAWSMHLSWNLMQMFMGLPVSGKYISTVSLTGDLIQGSRDNIIAGGGYGPEASIVTVIVQLTLLLGLIVYIKKWKRLDF